MKLLSVDWDYFFPKIEHSSQPRFSQEWALYDWGHKESRLMIDLIWGTRAAGFLAAGLSLPGTTGEEEHFWARFHFTKRAKLYLAESHSALGDEKVIGHGVREIVNFDAHHDAGYHHRSFEDALRAMEIKNDKGIGHRMACDDWAVYAAARGIPVVTKYPAWRSWAMNDEGGEPEPEAPIERMIDDGTPFAEPFGRVFVCRSGAWTPSWLDDKFETFVKAAGLEVVVLQPPSDRAFNMADVEQDVKHIKAVELINEAITEGRTPPTHMQALAQVGAVSQEEADAADAALAAAKAKDA